MDVYNDYENSRKKGAAGNLSSSKHNEQSLFNMQNFKDDK